MNAADHHNAADRPIVKVLTINIWNRQGPWEKRFELLRDGIAELSPDVIGMQEVLSDGNHTLAHEIVDSLADSSGYQVVFGPAHTLGGGIVLGNAVATRFAPIRHEVALLPSVDTDEERSVLITELAAPGGTLPFLVTHLAWRFHHGYVREQQVQAIARLFKERLPIRDDVLPAVLVGDMNARPDATEIRFLSGLHALDGKSIYLADCYEEVGESPGYTFDGRRNPFAAITQEAARRIDYVFVRGPDKKGRGKPLSARVVLDRIVDGVGPSDHYGVYCEIRM